MTHALLEDLRREERLVDVTIVDNGHDYRPVGDETVLRPGENLGWAAGTNFGTTECLSPEHAAVVWMNNDTRLAAGFFAGLVGAWEETGAGLIGALAGLWLVLALGPAAQLGALALLAVAATYGEFRSLSALVERVPLVRGLDSLGRI